MKPTSKSRFPVLTALIALIAMSLFFFAARAQAREAARARAHEMQHGFILSDDDRFVSHLVANGHHSHQTSITGRLEIPDPVAREKYLELKRANIADRQVYFILLGQKVNLPGVRVGQVLSGPITAPAIGDWDPQAIVVPEARFRIQKIHVNVVNPFFTDP